MNHKSQHSLMSREECSRTLATLENLCASIREFIDHHAQHATYRAPIIDYHHPDDYRQRGITGLKKFLGHAEAEREYVVKVSDSGLQRSVYMFKCVELTCSSF